MLVYISGPYTADTPEKVQSNINAAAEAAGAWMRLGHSVICPHTNSGGIEAVGFKFDHATWIRADLTMLTRCDCIAMLPEWERSKGACEERAHAESLGIPVYDAKLPQPLHPTELRSPVQVKAFAETLGKMYRIHLDKNADYSPANILGTGEIGLITRLWDKTARLMNLLGFRFAITEAASYEPPSEPKNESIEDTFIDLANYSVIGRLLRAGKWGR